VSRRCFLIMAIPGYQRGARFSALCRDSSRHF
jgi:hypothetical protein